MKLKLPQSVLDEIAKMHTELLESGLMALDVKLADMLDELDGTIQKIAFVNKGDSWLMILTADVRGRPKVAYAGGASPLACAGDLCNRWESYGVKLKDDNFALEKLKKEKLDKNT